MSGRDPFDDGMDAAGDLHRALNAMREDVREIVRQEVERAGLPESELHHLVGETVRREVARNREQMPRWAAPAWMGVGVAVGVLAGALGYRAITAGSGGAADAGAVASGAAAEAAADPGGRLEPSGEGSLADPGRPAASPAGAPDAAAPAELVARFDSLFEERSPALAPLLADLERGAVPAVLQAIESWRAGGSLAAGPERRLHDALVQAALNRIADAGLVLDGLVSRNPCGGASCGALLRVWEARGDELGLPPYPSGAAAREAALPTVERVVVLRGLEAAGG